MKLPATLSLVGLVLLSAALTSFAQSSPGIESLSAEDQQIVRGLEFKNFRPAPIDMRHFTYIKGEFDLVNNGPKNSITDKLDVEMAMLFVNKDGDWVVVNCGKRPFAVTTKGQELIHVSGGGQNDLFETWLGNRKAEPLTTHAIVRYDEVTIYEQPLDPRFASAPAEWWTKKTGAIGHASADVIAALPTNTSPASSQSPKAPVSVSKITTSSIPQPVPSAPASVSPAAPVPKQSTTTPVVMSKAVTSSTPLPPTSVPPSAPVQVSAPVQTLLLDRGWQTPLQGGSATLKDLGAILSPFAKPSINLSAVPGLKLYEGVTYLMPYEQAKKALNLNQRVVPKNKVNCPGFPKDSFFHYAFDGTFEGHFNKLYIVTDKADQVVAIQFVAESPKRENVEAPRYPTDAHTYNFINYRGKGTKRLWVEHIAFFHDKKGDWRRFRNPSISSYDQPEGPVDILRIDSLLMDPDASSSGFRRNNWKPLEAVRLYLPKPMMELILQCVNSPAR